MAFLIYHRGAIRYEKYFPGYGPDFRTDSFSGHKTVMGLLLAPRSQMAFVSSVDEPAAKYLPEFAGDGAQGHPHSRPVADGERTGSAAVSRPDVDPVDIRQRHHRVRRSSLPQEKPPGTDFQYSNVNAELLGIIIQRATKQRYAEYLS